MSSIPYIYKKKFLTNNPLCLFQNHTLLYTKHFIITGTIKLSRPGLLLVVGSFMLAHKSRERMHDEEKEI